MCPVMIITIYFEADHKKLVSSQKSSIFGPQKGHFVQSGPRNGPPNGQTATYQKTKGIQSSLRIWRSCHPIESGPSEPKKWGFHRCSVKKRRISGKKCSFFGQEPIFFGNCPILFVTTMTGHQKDNIFLLTPLHGCPKKKVSGQKQHFWTPKGPLWAIGATKRAARRPNGHLPENQRFFFYFGPMVVPTHYTVV